MKIQRSMFFALTAAISACVVHEHDGNMPSDPSSGGGTIANNSTPASPAAPPAPHTVPAPPPPPAPHVAPAPPPPPAPAPSNRHVIIEPMRPGGACLDVNAGTIPHCVVTCASNQEVAIHCGSYSVNFNPKVAAAAVSCMNGLTANNCDMNAAYNCGKTALAQSCINPQVTALCQTAEHACSISTQDCAQMLSGLNAKGQAAVSACVAKGCSAGLYSCVEGLIP